MRNARDECHIGNTSTVTIFFKSKSDEGLRDNSLYTILLPVASPLACRSSTER